MMLIWESRFPCKNLKLFLKLLRDVLSNLTMKRFYPDFESINAFTLSLDYHQNELECMHCLKSKQFVSHGIVYKQRSIEIREKVGKRIFCSNRFGRTGCGRTFQLYMASEIPRFRYGAAHLFVFITVLMTGQKIEQAYEQATQQYEHRNAWRWLSRLMRNLSQYRSYLKVRKNNCTRSIHSTSQYLKHLLPTLARLLTSPHSGCFDYQIRQQQPFF